MNATIAEFVLRQASDAAKLAQRVKVLAALTQLSPERRNELAEAVNVVCRTIAAHGGRGRVRFSLVQRGGNRYIEVSVCDQHARTGGEGKSSPRASVPPPSDDRETAVIQRVGEMLDYFESSGWPFSGAVIRMAQALSPAFPAPTESEVADWAQMLHANTALDALAFALSRARTLESALGHARCQEELRAGLAARASEAENLTMLSLVISKTKNAITILEPDGTIIAVNDAFLQLTGFDAAEAVGDRHDELLFGPSTDPAAIGRFREALATGRELTQDIMQYRKDGRTFWVESNLIPVAGATGEVTRWIAIDNDVTKRRQTEDALRTAKETAETNSRLKSEFLANLSHEIRTPMNAIIGMTELALGTELTDEQRGYLQVVRSSSESLLGLLNDILDLSKIEAGKMEMEDIDFQLAEVIRDTVKALEVRAREKGLRITCDLPADLPQIVRGDPTKLRQILLNLVGNAIKFTAHGEVAIEVEQQWRSEDETGLHFLVRDTGIGIPPDKLDKIFQAFTQADASTTRKYGGSGLGLTITSELVRMMQGRIWVQSTVGSGSTFHFAIRLRLGSSAQTPSVAADAAQRVLIAETGEPHDRGPKTETARRPLRVLVADDHDANRHLVVTVLKKRGHICSEAANGREAIEALARGEFDVALMDVQMPVLDGYQATAEIRRREADTGRHLPIIALTAHAMTGDREKCLAAGMDAYLPKPLRPKELITLVESVLELKQTASGPAGKGEAAGEDDPGFDLAAARESLDNDMDLLLSQMNFFLHDAPILASHIREAIEGHDSHHLQLASHRLKGMLARYAYHEAASIAYQLEQMGRDGDPDGALPLWHELVPLVDRLATAIRHYIAGHA